MGYIGIERLNLKSSTNSTWYLTTSTTEPEPAPYLPLDPYRPPRKNGIVAVMMALDSAPYIADRDGTGSNYMLCQYGGHFMITLYKMDSFHRYDFH